MTFERLKHVVIFKSLLNLCYSDHIYIYILLLYIVLLFLFLFGLEDFCLRFSLCCFGDTDIVSHLSARLIYMVRDKETLPCSG